MRTHSIPSVALQSPYVVNTGNGAVASTHYNKKISTVVSQRELYASPLVHRSGDFDLILGMDWLSTFHAVIDCRRKSVEFRIPGHPEFIFFNGSSTLMPAEYFAKPVQGKLFALGLGDREVPALVEEFMDVFSESAGLPPKREVWFRIDLQPRMKHIL